MAFMDFFRAGGKAPSAPADIPAKVEAPKIEDSVRDSGTTFFMGMSTSGTNVNERSALQIATVYACVRILAETIASLPLNMYRKTNDYREEAIDHPLYHIVHDEANDEMSSFTFWETVMTHLLLWGNAYCQIVRTGKNNIVGLYPLLPDRVEVDRNDKGQIYYIYHNSSDDTQPDYKNQGDITFRKDEILHIPGLSFNGLVGFSPIAMMKNSLGSAIAVDRYGSDFFAHNAQPVGVLEHPGNLKNPQKIRENWMDTYGGVGNSHKVAVLEEGMSYKPITLPPEDSQFLSTKEFSVEEICRIFRVPPHLVQDLKRSTYNNIEHQGIAFVTYTLMPWMVRIEKALKKDCLLPDEKTDYYFKFNANSLMRGDTTSRMEGYAKGFTNGIYAVDEIRAMEDLPPIGEEEGGNKHVMNGSYVEVKEAGIAYKQKIGSTPNPAPSEETEESEETDGTDKMEKNNEANTSGSDYNEDDEAGASSIKHSKGYERRKAERRKG